MDIDFCKLASLRQQGETERRQANERENSQRRRLRNSRANENFSKYFPGCRRCGKPTCHCAKLNDSGHDPQLRLTSRAHGKTVAESFPSPVAFRKVQAEVHEYRRFQSLCAQFPSRAPRAWPLSAASCRQPIPAAAEASQMSARWGARVLSRLPAVGEITPTPKLRPDARRYRPDKTGCFSPVHAWPPAFTTPNFRAVIREFSCFAPVLGLPVVPRPVHLPVAKRGPLT
jgi:hypothetical protein